MEEVSSGGQRSLSLQVPVSLCESVVFAPLMGHVSSILYIRLPKLPAASDF